MSSCIGVFVNPFENIYSATKIFNTFSGLGLAEEFRDKIDCQTVCHGIVYTGMNEGYTGTDGVTPEFAADYATDKLGFVEETSSDVRSEFLTYGPLLSLYYCSLDLYFYIFENAIWTGYVSNMTIQY